MMSAVQLVKPLPPLHREARPCTPGLRYSEDPDELRDLRDRSGSWEYLRPGVGEGLARNYITAVCPVPETPSVAMLLSPGRLAAGQTQPAPHSPRVESRRTIRAGPPET